MHLTYFGHSSFLIESDMGARILTDPFPQNIFPHRVMPSDAVSVSHAHFDHCEFEQSKGTLLVDTMDPITVGDIRITAVPSFHDCVYGKERGYNRIYIFEADGFRVAHLGDLGPVPDEFQTVKLANLDALLCPIGGTYTLDPAGAFETVKKLAPKCVIPMHYRLPGHAFDTLETASAFTGLFPEKDVLVSPSDTVELPADVKVVVLTPCLEN